MLLDRGSEKARRRAGRLGIRGGRFNGCDHLSFRPRTIMVGNRGKSVDMIFT